MYNNRRTSTSSQGGMGRVSSNYYNRNAGRQSTAGGMGRRQSSVPMVASQTRNRSSAGGVYGQYQNNPYAVGHGRNIGGTMFPVVNPERSWSIQHQEHQAGAGIRGNTSPYGSRSMTQAKAGQSGSYYSYAASPQYAQQTPTYGGGGMPQYSQISYQPQQMQMQRQQQQLQAQSYYDGGSGPSSGQEQGQSSSMPVSVAKISIPESHGTTMTGELPPELQNNPDVKYVSLNWEDILGGKDGLNGLKISMAQPAPGAENQNRQIRFGMGGEQVDDGSTPLKIVSFQPLEDFPGKINTTSSQSDPSFPKFSVQKPGTASPGNYNQPQAQSQPQPQQKTQYTAASKPQQQQQPQIRGIPGYTGRAGVTRSSTNCGSSAGYPFQQPYAPRR